MQRFPIKLEEKFEKDDAILESARLIPYVMYGIILCNKKHHFQSPNGHEGSVLNYMYTTGSLVIVIIININIIIIIIIYYNKSTRC